MWLPALTGPLLMITGQAVAAPGTTENGPGAWWWRSAHEAVMTKPAELERLAGAVSGGGVRVRVGRQHVRREPFDLGAAATVGCPRWDSQNNPTQDATCGNAAD